ncbi:hypothetical protein Z517_09437 [Fonsecaea pedrosoi CBS 271.37]|uniref:Protein kinase domain-containing protein n=1 Tax=Fonsecaea pedrosoi CBS 271.37 TaxID=1442368 RepID=A0A0D2G8K8_9EURO|nr:uncharacterized protein Z517_09437 [Fonsecaea pedrosoi CBS 271.37]KIW76993.1 hypothetical protein Z517_09437 [Fonsecaea pedrosoi CBS 271.37]
MKATWSLDHDVPASLVSSQAFITPDLVHEIPSTVKRPDWTPDSLPASQIDLYMDLPESNDRFWMGKCLSEEPMTEKPFRNPSEDPMLRRFKDSDEEFEYLEFLGKGEQGIVVSASINGVRYAVKFVETTLLLEDKEYL